MGGAKRCCDVDAGGGPLECRQDEDEWDGVSVWIGQLPGQAVCRADGADDGGGAVQKRDAEHLFHSAWQLVDELRDHLEKLGEGLGQDAAGQPAVTVSQQPSGLSWALLTFRRKQDAAQLLSDGLSSWKLPETGQPCEGLLLKRALPAEQAEADLEDLETAERARHETVELAVSRIYAWLKRESGKSLKGLFKQIDTDGSGDFDVTEFRVGMLEIGLTFDDDTIAAMFTYLDKDGEGTVDTAEFIANMETFEHLMGVSSTAVLIALCQVRFQLPFLDTFWHIFDDSWPSFLTDFPSNAAPGQDQGGSEPAVCKYR